MMYYSLKKEPSLLNNILVRNRRIVQTFYASTQCIIKQNKLLAYVLLSNV